MILIFDTYGGLCNQMYDIHAAINYCLLHNIEFSFRYSCLRYKHDLTKWYDVPFNELFNDDFIDTKLYIPINKLDCNNENTFLFYNKKRCIEWLNYEKALFPQLDKINKKYIILRQFWSVCKEMHYTINLFQNIIPCRKLLNIYNEIKFTLPEKYNYIHYRYEDDFITHFAIKNHRSLCNIIESNIFKNNDLITYIAAYNIENIPKKYMKKDITKYKNIIYKK